MLSTNNMVERKEETKKQTNKTKFSWCLLQTHLGT